MAFLYILFPFYNIPNVVHVVFMREDYVCYNSSYAVVVVCKLFTL